MNTENLGALAPILTPHGRLLLAAERDAPILAEALRARLADAFTRSAGHGLLRLGAAEVGSALPPAFAWWRDFSAHYVTALCATTEAGENDCVIAVPETQDLDEWVANAPPMTGSEYLTAD
ncbi:MAG TPA: ATP-dependent helicase, partial [Gammaproteobacteria bacterium]